MKRLSILLAVLLGSFLLIAADGCSSDPNVEGAKLDLRNKDYDRALENLETALENNPQNAEALQLKGQVLQAKAAEVQDAEQHTQLIQDMLDAYNQALEVDPGLSETVENQKVIAYVDEFNRGSQAFQRGREDRSAYNQAVTHFDLANDIQPDSAAAYVNEAYALLNTDQQQEAIQPFETAIELGNTEAQTYILLANLYNNNEQYDKTITLLEEGQELHPANEDIQAQLLNAYSQTGQIDRAMQSYADAVANDPDNKLYRYNYGSMLLEAEEYDKAIEQLEAAINIDPEYANAQYNLGASYINKAVGVNEQITAIDDEIRANSDSLSEDEIAQKEQQMEELTERRRSLFQQAITPLEKAHELTQAEGGDATGICQALFQAYVQTGQDDQARALADCAGYDLDN